MTKQAQQTNLQPQSTIQKKQIVMSNVNDVKATASNTSATVNQRTPEKLRKDGKKRDGSAMEEAESSQTTRMRESFSLCNPDKERSSESFPTPSLVLHTIQLSREQSEERVKIALRK